MRRPASFFIAVIVCATASVARAQAHPASITVRVESAETNPAKPVAGARVALYYLVNDGQSIRESQNPTGARGEATLDVSPSVTQTGAVRLEVVNPQGLVILTPADGQLTALPPTVELVLVRKGSVLLLGPAQVQAMLKRMSLQVTSLQKQVASSQQQKPDLEAALNAWAAENGLMSTDVDQHVKQWAEDVQKQTAQSTEEQLGLAAMALRHYDEAAQHFGASKTSALNSLTELQKQQTEQTRAALASALQATQQTAYALQLGSHLQSATAVFEDTMNFAAPVCAQYATQTDVERVCVDLLLDLADARCREGSDLGGAAGLALVQAAVEDYRKAIQTSTLLQRPGQQAIEKKYLSDALVTAGDLSSGDQAKAFYSQAAQAFFEYHKYMVFVGKNK